MKIYIDPDKYSEEDLGLLINALRDIGIYAEAAELETEVLNRRVDETIEQNDNN